MGVPSPVASASYAKFNIQHAGGVGEFYVQQRTSKKAPRSGEGGSLREACTMVLPSGLSLTGKIRVCTLASVSQGLVARALPHACMELDADDPRQSSPSLAMFLPPVPL
jgi:hypothetical protein